MVKRECLIFGISLLQAVANAGGAPMLAAKGKTGPRRPGGEKVQAEVREKCCLVLLAMRGTGW